MATSSGTSTRSLFNYFGPRAGPDGLKLGMPVTPEEVCELLQTRKTIDLTGTHSFAA